MSENVAHLFQEAIAKDKAGDAEESMKLLDTLLQYQGDHRMGLFYRGSLKIRENDVAGAIKDWEQAFAGTDANTPARVQEQFGEIVESSLSHFAFETTVDPNDPIPHAAYGKAARIFGRSEAAQRHLQRAFELDRLRWREGLISAELLIRAGQMEPAQQVLQKILESQPENAEVQYTLGLYFQQTNSLAFALRHLEKAAALDPHFTLTRQLLADIYLHQGRYEQAETQYQFLVKYAPSARAHMGVAQCVKQQYRFEEALEQYRAAVALEPEHFGALCDLGALALQFGDLELGMESLKKALEIDPNQPDIYGHLAKAAQQKGDSAEAIRSYRKLLAMEANNSDASYSLANLLRAQGEYEEAAELLSKALERRLGDVQVSLELSDCLVHLDRQPEALKLLQDCFVNNPNHKELRQALSRLDSSVSAEDTPAAPSQNFEEFVTLAQLHLRQNRTEEAAQAFRSALAIKPDHAESLLHLGRIYANRGLLEPGADLVLQSYNAHPDPEVLTELLAMAWMMDGFERDDTLGQLVTALLKKPDRRDWFDLLLTHPDEPVQRLLPDLMRGYLAAVPADHAIAKAWNEHLIAQQPAPESVAPAPVAAPVYEAPPAPVAAPPAPAPVVSAPVVAAPVTLPPLADALPAFDLVCYVQPHKVDKRTTMIEEQPPAAPPWQAGPPVVIERSMLDHWTSLPALDTLPKESPAPFYRELARSLAAAGWVQEAVAALGKALLHEPGVGGNWMPELLANWCAGLEKEGHLAGARQVCADWRHLFPQDAQAQAAHARLGDPAPVAAPAAAAPHSWVTAIAEPFAVADAVLAFDEPAAAPAVESIAAPVVEAAPEPTVEAVAESAPEPVVKAVAEPVAAPEPVVEAATEVAAEPVVEAVAEPVVAPEPVVEAVAEPVVAPEPVVKAVAEPVVAPEPVVEPVVAPEPVVEAVAEPVVAPEPVVEAIAEPVVAPEPVVEAVAEPVVAPEPVVEAASVAEANADSIPSLIESILSATAPLAASVVPAPAAVPAPVAPPAAVAPPTPPAPVAAPTPAAPPAPVAAPAPAASPAPVAAPPAPVAPPTPAPPVAKPPVSTPHGAAAADTPSVPAGPPMRLSKPASIAEFQKQLREYPDMNEALDWGWDLANQQESEFLNIFRDLTKTETAEPRHVRNFARAYLRLGRPLLAVVQFQKFLNASPSPKGYRELADVYQKLNRERNATEALAKAEEMEKSGVA